MAYCKGFRRLQEMAAIIIRGVFLFFQEGGAKSTTLRQVTGYIIADSNCPQVTFIERLICAVVIYGDGGPCLVRMS